jgi:hypothetical protein
METVQLRRSGTANANRASTDGVHPMEAGWKGPLWVIFLLTLAVTACTRAPAPGTVLDEAMRAGRADTTFPAADADYFHDMDGALALSPQEIQGRDTWLVWSGGNDRFWDGLTRSSFGALDFLKTISSHPGL